MASSDWIQFWDRRNSIYVNERHAKAHANQLADDIGSYVPDGGTMLDYGCGEALSADRAAARVSQLILCDAAASVRTHLSARYAGNTKITVRQPEDVAAIPAHSIDTIVMHSVAQYLTERELDEVLKVFHRLLRPGGLLVLGDVIPRKLSMFADAHALLRFGRDKGFCCAALRGLIRTYFSDYRKLRHSLGVARYDASEITAKLEGFEFATEPAPTNIGHNKRRMTFLGHAR
jgi:SAM-dependent methyltransferase